MNFLLWNRKLNRDEWMENRRSVLASPILVEGGRRIRGWGEVLCGWFVDDTEDTLAELLYHFENAVLLYV